MHLKNISSYQHRHSLLIAFLFIALTYVSVDVYGGHYNKATLTANALPTGTGTVYIGADDSGGETCSTTKQSNLTGDDNTNLTFTVTATASSGYKFNNWTAGTNVTNVTAPKTATTNCTISGTRSGTEGTITANFVGITYYVAFNGNNKTSGEMTNQTFQYGTAQNLKANEFVRQYSVSYNPNDGTPTPSNSTATYSFNGWSGNGQTYTNGQSVSNLTTTENQIVTLTAQWTGGSVTLPSEVTRNGYSFAGWYDAQSGGNLVGNAGASYTPNNSSTLYAHWNPTDYIITFNTDGGSDVTTPLQYNIESTSTLPTTSKANMSFNGWLASNANGNWTNGTTYGEGISLTGKYGNVTLTAQWEPSTHAINIRVSGLQNGEQAIFTVTGNGQTYTVSMGNGTQKIKNVAQGSSYTVTPTGWSYGYNVNHNSLTNTINNDTDFEFVFTEKTNRTPYAETAVQKP